jgi:manganese oxidase
VRHALKRAALLASALAVSGCGSDATSPGARNQLEPFPPTGVTKTFDFTIDDNVTWEVGPGALYSAITYNKQVPGPPIEVTAGDHVRIRLTNNGAEPHSIHTHVTAFTIDNDGVDDPSLVPPGETRTIEWDAAFPGTFPYHDHGAEGESVARGLFGAVIVHAPDEVPATEQLVVLSDFEQASYIQLPGVADPVTGEFPAEGTYRGGHQYMHTINGKAYEDGVPPFHAKLGDLVRWRVVSIGQEFHTWHVHGHRWLDADGSVTDNVALGPGMYTTFEFREDAPGNWLVHCHVPSHLEGGMMARYVVE